MAAYSRCWIAFRFGFGFLLAVATLTGVNQRFSHAQFSGGDLGLPGDEDKVLQASAYFTGAVDGKPAMLHVTGEIAPEWHTYSITQEDGGPIKTKIKLAKSNDFKLAGEFKASVKPTTHHYEDIWPKLPVEEHEGSVTWSAPIEFSPGVDVKKLKIAGSIYAQLCKKECLPPTNYEFTATLQGPAGEVPTGQAPGAGSVNNAKQAAPPTGTSQAVEEYTKDGTHAKLRGAITPGTVAAGGKTRLTISADVAPDFHIYAWAKQPPDSPGSRPTLIVVAGSDGFRFGEPKADSEPIAGPADTGQPSFYYKKPVTWSIDVEIPANTKPGPHRIAGIVGFQTCKDTACDLPNAAWFDGTITVGDQKNDAPAKLVFWKAKYAEAAKLSKEKAPAINEFQSSGDTPEAVVPTFKLRELNSSTNQSFVYILASAFVGGIILNFMPCVLPVIGLKILTFVEQSGHDRRRVFVLNLWYSLGLIAVFMVLAILASGASLGLFSKDLAWGEQFNDTTFNIVMSGIVFAMALSFMGVWEIPIPGFAGSGGAAKLAKKEGAMGAFAKGALSTVLATPCSGPLLGAVFGYTLKQHWSVTFMIFGMIGLGMASPYLLIGAFPRLIRFLPKPGAWMDTFKHLMGFVLLGTVVYLLTFLKAEYVVPTFGMLVGIWAACWIIGRVTFAAEIGQKLRAWAAGLATAAIIGWICFSLLLHTTQRLPWKPFSPEALAKYQAEGKTVMVDFTAVWCPTCKWNLKFVIDTDDVLKVVEENNVVPLLADFSDVDGSPEIKAMLKALDSKSIPVLAVFPADKPDEALILRDVVTKGQVIGALKEAGPSKADVSVARAL